MRAEDLKIEIHDAAGEPVRGCELALDVSADRRLGEGWAKLGDKERLHGLEFAETDSHYGLNLPVDVEPNELLISTAEPGNVARLSNTALDASWRSGRGLQRKSCAAERSCDR